MSTNNAVQKKVAVTKAAHINIAEENSLLENLVQDQIQPIPKHARTIDSKIFDQLNTGLPPLQDDDSPAVSPFEFWPTWIFYTPVVLQSLVLGIRHLNFSLPLIVNPGIELSGMVGESKHDVLQLAGSVAKQWISPYIVHTRTDEAIATQVQQLVGMMSEQNLKLPVVAKPDIGCRGAGVRLIESYQQLQQYLQLFPSGQRLLIQEKAPYEAEAGVFYLRYPGEERGQIISLTLKYTPFVLGDGEKTLEQLIRADKRAGKIAHLYLARHEDALSTVVPAGKKYRLSFSGSHCRGSIFRDGNRFITDALCQRLDAIVEDMPGYYYGRLDIKFKDIDSFMAGNNFTILEANGVSSEAAHIWDRCTPLKEIFKTLLFQYRSLYKIGAIQRQLGHKVPSLFSLFPAWRKERLLVNRYPSTD